MDNTILGFTFTTLFSSDKINGSNNLVKQGYKVENLMDFPGH